MKKFLNETATLIAIAVIAVTLALYAVDFVESFHLSHAPEMSTCE